MARKNLLKGLMEEASKNMAEPPAPSTADQRVDTAKPRYSGGAIGAVSQSIAQLQARALEDIDPFDIKDGGLTDRLDDEDADHEALVASIRDYGQQVPVLVRPHPEEDGKYQVVYGRRRVRAMRDLKMPVKTLVRTLDDRDMIVAQGQENSARKGLSFIEKASFAKQMSDMGYDRKIICDSLHVDKTVISRMLSVVERLDEQVIYAIGAAPNVGRDRWLRLAELMEEREWTTGEAIALSNGQNSDARFEALVKALTISDRRSAEAAKTRTASDTPARLVLKDEDGTQIATVDERPKKTVLTLPKAEDGFDRWLVQNITEIHRRFKEGGE